MTGENFYVYMIQALRNRAQEISEKTVFVVLVFGLLEN
jgi:hypothetical protein